VTRCRFIVGALMMCLIAGTAHAENRIAVRPFFGPHGEDVRREVLAILSQHRQLTLVPTREVETKARELGVDPDSPEGRIRLAPVLGVAAWVEAIVERQGRALRATVLMYEGREHRRIARTVITRESPKELMKALRRSLWRESRDALLLPRPQLRHQPARAPRPGARERRPPEREVPEASPFSDSPQEIATTDAPAEPSVPAQAPAWSSTSFDKVVPFSPEKWIVRPVGASSSEPLPDSLITSLSVGTLTRSLQYEDAQTQSLGNYSLPIAPQASLDLSYFPGAHLTARWPSHFGLDLKAQLALAGASETRAGDKYRASAYSYAAGARARLPFGPHEASLLAGYGVRRVEFVDSKSRPSPTPDVDYRYLRMGAEADFAVSDRLRIGAGGAWLWLFSGGELTSRDWFARTTGSGFEASVFGSYGLTSHLDLVASVGLSHFFFSFHPKPGDPKVAGGATDDFVTGGLGIRLRL